jgi:hypothetical protein
VHSSGSQPVTSSAASQPTAALLLGGETVFQLDPSTVYSIATPL